VTRWILPTLLILLVAVGVAGMAMLVVLPSAAGAVEEDPACEEHEAQAFRQTTARKLQPRARKPGQRVSKFLSLAGSQSNVARIVPWSSLASNVPSAHFHLLRVRRI